MPVSEGADFIAIDEIQLAQDPDRGHVFTDRILHARGRHETMLLGADTMRPALQRLDLDIDGERRERFSQLSYVGPDQDHQAAQALGHRRVLARKKSTPSPNC